MLIIILSHQQYWQEALTQGLNASNINLLTVENITNSSALLTIEDSATELRLHRNCDGMITTLEKPVRLDNLVSIILAQLADCFYQLRDVKFYCWRRIIEGQNGQQTTLLTEKEGAVLDQLLQHGNTFVNKKALLQSVWKYHDDSETNAVETLLHRLRNKLAKHGLADIITATDLGYGIHQQLKSNP